MAECHPVGFQWVMEAKARGATVVHVDPRFTRTSALADLHVPIRAGANIVFLGGIINYVLANEHSRLRGLLHQRGDAADRGLHRHRGPGRRVLRPGPRAPHLQHRVLALPRCQMSAAAGRRDRPARPSGSRRRGPALADVQRRVQALHRGRLPGRVPDRCAVPHRVRHRGGPGRRVQRLRLLRPGLPVRRDRPARAGRAGAQVHAVLRPAGRRPRSRPARRRARPSPFQFGPLDELRERAQLRVGELRDAGQDQARLYLEDPADGIGGGGAFFLLLDEPEVYGLPPDPVVTTRDLPGMWKHVAIAAAGLAATAVALGLGRRR